MYYPAHDNDTGIDKLQIALRGTETNRVQPCELSADVLWFCLKKDLTENRGVLLISNGNGYSQEPDWTDDIRTRPYRRTYMADHRPSNGYRRCHESLPMFPMNQPSRRFHPAQASPCQTNGPWPAGCDALQCTARLTKPDRTSQESTRQYVVDDSDDVSWQMDDSVKMNDSSLSFNSIASFDTKQKYSPCHSKNLSI